MSDPTEPAELEILSRNVVTPAGVRPGVVRIANGRIVEVDRADSPQAAPERRDLGDAFLLPGLVDTHVHVNEPGRTEWEGFAHATRAAAAGGVTTIVDMPLNSIPATTTVAALQAKREAASRQCAVDVSFWAGVVPGHQSHIEPLAAEGVPGFKCFLVPSGVEEFPAVEESDLRAAMPALARVGLPLLVHAESPGGIAAAERAAQGRDQRRYDTYLASRPEEAELEAIELLLRLCEATGCRLHIVHLSAAAALPMLEAARARGLPVTVETCPHHLFLGAEDVRDGDTLFKCAPPLRDRGNRERLWDGLRTGVIDLVASDHSPSPPARKAIHSGSFFQAWGGIASLGLGLSVVWTDARPRGFTIHEVVRWMAERPAGLAGLGARKGRIAPGYDADLVVWDPSVTWTVDENRLWYRHRLTPYLGRRLTGMVVATYLRGTHVYESGELMVQDSGMSLDRETGSV